VDSGFIEKNAVEIVLHAAIGDGGQSVSAA
jgi:hypothetical protein